MAKKKLTEYELKQLELKERYMEIIRTEVWPENKHMQDYEFKEFGNAVELANGDIYIIEKPRIHTDFCFGYGYCGVSTEEDDDLANKAAANAKTNADYFIKENLKEFDERIERLMDPRYEKYKYIHYSGQPSGSKLKAYSCCHICDNPEYAPYRWNNLQDVEELTEEEIAALIAGFKAAKEMFTKRLNTYLKRYGLSKLNVWTYLRD